ncbi:hypothetical protein PT300_01875 [Enterobacteriaceae bacterium ESL0689]|nr:hypothetical protein [Enterobacteriaceae bacterium ESL0689]
MLLPVLWLTKQKRTNDIRYRNPDRNQAVNKGWFSVSETLMAEKSVLFNFSATVSLFRLTASGGSGFITHWFISMPGE